MPSLNVLLEIVGGLGEVGGAAEVAPVVGVGAEAENFLALGGEAEVGGDDGEDAFFGEHGEKAGRDEVDAGEGERLERIGRANDFGGLITSGAAAAELEVAVEEEGAGSFAGLDGERSQGSIFRVKLQHRS